MNTQKNIRSFFIIVLSSLLGVGLLFIPNIDKRLIALIGMVIFAIFFYGIFLTNKKQLSVASNLVIGNIWILLFPVPYILTHLWTLSGLLIIFTFMMGSFLGYLLFSTKNNTRKIGLLGVAVVYYLIFYFWLYPALVEIGLSYT